MQKNVFEFQKNIIKKYSKTAIKFNQTSVNKLDVENHSKLANEWWDPNGKLKALHSFNTLRVPFIRDGLISNNQVDHVNKYTSKPLKNLKILDVGCGGGILSEALARIGAKVTGLDASEDLINIAKKHAECDLKIKDNLYYLNSSIEDFTSNEKFDAVVLSEIVEHVPDKTFFIVKNLEFLKQNGSIFITTINRTLLSWILSIIMAEYVINIVPRGTHEWKEFVSPLELKQILESNNCYIKSKHGTILNPITNTWHWIDYLDNNYCIHAVNIKQN